MMNNFASFRQVVNNHLALNSACHPWRDCAFGMSEMMEVDTKDLVKSGVLTKKDVLRWSLDSALLRNSEFKTRSDFFTFGPCRNSKFYLIAFGNGYASFFTVGLGRIRLANTDENMQDEIPIKVAFSLLDMRDRCHHTCERTFKDSDAVQASFDRNSITTHHAMFLHDGRLRIHCALDVDEVLKEEEMSDFKLTSQASSPIENLSGDLATDFRKLLQSGLHSNVILSIDGKEFPAHRSILAARSPVFAAMFKHDTLESNQNRVVIEDISSEAMYQLLCFLYTGETEELDNSELLSLFVAADKYNLPQLKKKCSSLLCSKVTHEMALNVLVVANLHQDDDLKNAAIQVVLDNAISVMSSDEWLVFLREYSEVANGIILKLAVKSLKSSDVKPASLTTNL